MLKKVLVFVDGENLVMRYQQMVKDGARATESVVHVPDTFVWHPKITTWSLFDVIRVCYYTSVVGDGDAVENLESRISGTYFESRGTNGMAGMSAIIPRVHKKAARSNKTKVVDVDITMDVMRAALTMPVDAVFLLSGDGDYLPLVREVTRSSKQIYLGAFSSGLAKPLKNNAEIFVDLDRLFFVEEKPERKGR